MRFIPVDSLEHWAEDATLNRSEVIDGDAALVLPNGQTWWVPVSRLSCDLLSLPRVKPEFYFTLESAILDHACLTEDGHHGFPPMVIEWGMFDLTRAYCLTCLAWVNLAAAVKTVDELGIREG